MAGKPTRRPLMAGNWKMNLNHLEAIALVQKLAFSLTEQQLSAVEVVVLPPFTDIRSVQTLIDGDKLQLGFGGQDISAHASGAYTGEISGAMLAKLGCSYVVVGHSERRQYHSESDELVNAKVKAALGNDITPILCVGEGLDIREAGQHVEHTLSQLDAALAGLTPAQVERVVVAYEPVWAIGTGRTATPAQAQEVHAHIRKRLAERLGSVAADAIRIQYGGSVKPNNAEALMAEKDIDGALVGGASLEAADFIAIVKAARGG